MAEAGSDPLPSPEHVSLTARPLSPLGGEAVAKLSQVWAEQPVPGHTEQVAAHGNLGQARRRGTTLRTWRETPRGRPIRPLRHRLRGMSSKLLQSCDLQAPSSRAYVGGTELLVLFSEPLPRR